MTHSWLKIWKCDVVNACYILTKNSKNATSTRDLYFIKISFRKFCYIGQIDIMFIQPNKYQKLVFKCSKMSINVGVNEANCLAFYESLKIQSWLESDRKGCMQFWMGSLQVRCKHQQK